MQHIVPTKIWTILISGDTYIPFVHKLQAINDYNKRLLQAQRQTKKVSAIPPPNVNPVYISTPKYLPTQNILHNANWKTQECNDWMRNKNSGRDVPLSTPKNTSNKHDHDDSIPKACTTGTNRHNNKYKITLVQSDIGANRCVTNLNISLLNTKTFLTTPLVEWKRTQLQ